MQQVTAAAASKVVNVFFIQINPPGLDFTYIIAGKAMYLQSDFVANMWQIFTGEHRLQRSPLICDFVSLKFIQPADYSR